MKSRYEILMGIFDVEIWDTLTFFEKSICWLYLPISIIKNILGIR